MPHVADRTQAERILLEVAARHSVALSERSQKAPREMLQALMQGALPFLAMDLTYDVPEQDLRVDRAQLHWRAASGA